MVQKIHSAKRSSRRFALPVLGAAISAVLAGYAGSAYAQQEQQEEAALEEITITGSRIRQTSGFTSPTPVTSLTTDELFNYEPGSSIAEQLDALPQFFGNTSLEGISTGQVSTSGSTSLDLRDLGSNRTLILFDGIRIVPASKQGEVNVDTFPTALIRSVDVVTGGASAAYGADAVGGVVNFVIDREFEGVEVEASAGRNEFGDGRRWNFSIAGGTQIGDKLNLIGSVEARKIDQFNRSSDEVPEQQRLGYVTNPEWDPSDPPGTHPQRITLPNVATTANSPYGLILGTDTELDMMRFTPDGESITPFVLGDVSSVGGPGSTQSTSGGADAAIYNRAYGGGIGATGGESRSAFLGAQYQFTDTFSAFAQAMLGRTEGSNVADRGGIILYSIWGPRIAVDNAYLPDNVRQTMLENGLEEFTLNKNGTFLHELEPGYGEEDSKVITTKSYSAGFDWDLPFRDWHVRGVVQDGTSERRSVFGQLWRVDRAFLAMDAVRDPATGDIVCRVQLYDPTPEELANSPAVAGRISSRSAPGAVSPGDPGAIPLRSPIGLDNTVEDCVPFNVMGAGNMSPEALDYVNGPSPKIGVGDVEQTFAEMLLTGELHEGWGAGTINFAAGLTWREQSFQDRTYPIDVDELGPPRNDPNLGIRGIPPGYANGGANLHYISTLPQISGEASVWEYFGQINVPLWQGNLGNQAQSLVTDLSFRQSDYERSGPVDSWKWGVDFQVLTDLRLRFTRSRDVREPTFAELFDSQGTNGVILDPRFNNNEFQISKIEGGNPNLAPEEADTVTAGFIYTPAFSWLEGLQLSLDWYDISIEGAVSSLGEQRIVDECFINNVQSLCEQIELNASGQVNRVHDTFMNVAEAAVKGVDMEVVYRFEPNFFGNQFETFNLRGLAGYLLERSDTPLDGTPLDSAGTLGSPDLTSVISATYGIGPFSIMLQNRYRSDVIQNVLWTEGVDVDDNTLPSYSWWNGRIAYSIDLNDGAALRFGFNVQNLFDNGPTPVPSVSTRFPIQGLTGDTYGRRYNISANYSF